MKRTRYSKGATWRKWDLHVHTPYSIIQHFGPNNEETWEKYLADLENLSSDFAVLGINDYLFIEGYERLLKEQQKNNRLKQLTLLPVIEFRIEAFAGVQFEGLKRINLHVIFSDEVPIETIKTQFLQTLEQHYVLNNGNHWHRAVNHKSLEELGKRIKQEMPHDKQSNISDIKLGFNNLNIKLESITDSLKKDCFNDKHLIAIGKTEWGKLKWTESSISTKKHLINSTDIVFTAAESEEEFLKAKVKLTNQKVNNLLLDCSDAHYFSSSNNKERIGNCLTWIKADPSFYGLRQIINEPESRIFVGEKPDIINRINKYKTRYIKSLFICNIDGYNYKYGKWFNKVRIPINSELVAIIGNKGSGKSALSDIIALCGNYHNHENYSFLKESKFRDGKHANNFEATLTWENNEEVKRLLSEKADTNDEEHIKYLPQEYFENITNEIGSVNKFREEIENVVYTYIDDEEKIGNPDFKSYINFKKRKADREIEALKTELKNINNDIIDLEEKDKTTYKNEINNKIRTKIKEIKALTKPKKVPNPDENSEIKTENEKVIGKIDKLKKKTQRLISEKKDLTEKKSKLILDNKKLKDLKNDIVLKVDELDAFLKSIKEELEDYNIEVNSLLKIKTDYRPIDLILEKNTQQLDDIRSKLDADKEGSIGYRLNKYKASLKSEKKKLDEPQRLYQKYLDDVTEWEDMRQKIKGDTFTPDTLMYLFKQRNYLKNQLIDDLNELYAKRQNYVKNIYNKKEDILSIYQTVKNKIDKIIHENAAYLDEHKININASLTLQSNFISKFLKHINQKVVGSFYSKEGGESFLTSLLKEMDVNSESDVINFLDKVLDALNNDLRNGLKNQKRDIQKQVFDIHEFYQFIFSLDYLEYNYELKQGEKELEQLSPGERGALLLVFYLLLDKSEKPLIIDQPEDNLDNNSVSTILVPFIKEAKKRRQIIMVTHNPNLAVYADADQVIYVEIDKDNENKFSFISGSIEYRKINECIVKVLEGTMPAFNKRRDKYYS